MSRINREGQTTYQKSMMVVGVMMTLVYLGLAAFIFLYGDRFTAIPKEFKPVFASILLMYGIFRGWKVYQKFFQEN